MIAKSTLTKKQTYIGLNFLFIIIFSIILTLPFFTNIDFKTYLRIVILIAFLLFLPFTQNIVKTIILSIPLLLASIIRFPFFYKFKSPSLYKGMFIYLHSTDMLAIFLFFAWLIFSFSGYKMEKDPFFISFLLIIFSYIFSSIFAIDKSLSILYIFFFISGYTIYRFILDFSLKHEGVFKIIMVIIYIYISINLLIALIQLKFGGIQLLGITSTEISTPFKGIRRIRGVYMHGNSLGGVIGIYLPFLFTSFILIKESIFSKKRGIILLFALFSIYLLYNTHSRNGYVSSFLGITLSAFLIILKTRKLGIFLKYLILMIILFFIGYWIISKTSPLLVIRIKNLMRPYTDVAIHMRFIMWEGAIRQFIKHPFTGIGVANFPYMPFSFGYAVAHSHYINLLLETGIWGLLGYISLYFIILYNLFKIWVKSKGNDFIIINGLTGGWIVYLIHNSFDTSFHTIFANEEMKTFFLFLAITSYFVVKFRHKES